MIGRIALIGGGEHARVVADALRASGRVGEVEGFVDDNEHMVELVPGIKRIGSDDDLDPKLQMSGILCFGGIGTAIRRRSAVVRLATRLADWANVVHSTAAVAPSVSMGAGTVVLAGVIVNFGVVIGEHCILNSGAIIEHDVTIGDHAQVSPGVIIGGGATIGANAYIGLGAKIRDHVSIGANAVVGMGAVVVRDVSPGSTVLGVPAR